MPVYVEVMRVLFSVVDGVQFFTETRSPCFSRLKGSVTSRVDPSCRKWREEQGSPPRAQGVDAERRALRRRGMDGAATRAPVAVESRARPPAGGDAYRSSYRSFLNRRPRLEGTGSDVVWRAAFRWPVLTYSIF